LPSDDGFCATSKRDTSGLRLSPASKRKRSLRWSVPRSFYGEHAVTPFDPWNRYTRIHTHTHTHTHTQCTYTQTHSHARISPHTFFLHLLTTRGSLLSPPTHTPPPLNSVMLGDIAANAIFFSKEQTSQWADFTVAVLSSALVIPSSAILTLFFARSGPIDPREHYTHKEKIKWMESCTGMCV
jgi:hypothetical protein